MVILDLDLKTEIPSSPKEAVISTEDGCRQYPT